MAVKSKRSVPKTTETVSEELRESKEISAFTIEDLRLAGLEMFEADIKGLSKYINNFSYEGFDPLVIYKCLAECAEKNARSSDEFTSDMAKLIILILVRGIKWSKSSEKMSDEGKKEVQRLKSMYSIIESSRPGKTDVIPGRIPAVFPALTANLLNSHRFMIPLAVKSDDLPVYLHFPQAPSIIPSSDSDTFNNWLVWAKNFDKVINPKSHDEAKVESYGNIAWRSNIHSDAERTEILDRLSEL